RRTRRWDGGARGRARDPAGGARCAVARAGAAAGRRFPGPTRRAGAAGGEGADAGGGGAASRALPVRGRRARGRRGGPRDAAGADPDRLQATGGRLQRRLPRACAEARRRLSPPVSVRRVLSALATGHKAGIAVVAGVFIAFALASSFLLPRLRPQFPGRRVGLFAIVTVLLTAGMLAAVIALAGEPKEKREAAGETTTEAT